MNSYHYTAIGDSVVYHQSMFLKKLSSQVYSGNHNRTWREKLGEFLESKPEQIGIFALIVIDLLVIVVQLFVLEPAIRCNPNAHPDHHKMEELEKAATALDIISLGILAILGMEMILLLIAFDVRFFKHPLYIIDTLVIAASMIFEYEQFKHHDLSAGSLLIFFRLWRIVRIVHGVAMSVQEKNEEQIKLLEEEVQKLKKDKAHIVHKFDYIKKRYKKLVDATKDEIASLPVQYARNRRDLTQEEEDSNMMAESLPSPSSPAMIQANASISVAMATTPPNRSVGASPFKSPGAPHPQHHVQIQVQQDRDSDEGEDSAAKLHGSKDYSTFNKK